MEISGVQSHRIAQHLITMRPFWFLICWFGLMLYGYSFVWSFCNPWHKVQYWHRYRYIIRWNWITPKGQVRTSLFLKMLKSHTLETKTSVGNECYSLYVLTEFSWHLVHIVFYFVIPNHTLCLFRITKETNIISNIHSYTMETSSEWVLWYIFRQYILQYWYLVYNSL